MPAVLPIDVLIQPQSKEAIQASLLSLCATFGLKTTSWQSGGAVLTILGVVAQIGAGFSTGVSMIARAGFLDLATGGFLTLLAYFLYLVTRTPATFANGDLTISNASGGLYKFAAGTFTAGLLAPGDDSVTYVNVAAFTLAPATGSTPSVTTVAFRASIAGSKGTASAGKIQRIVTAAAGVTFTNLDGFIGTDAELDPALRTRCRQKLGTLSPNGPKGSYQFVATSAVDINGVSLGVTRVQVLPVLGDGNVHIYLAGPSGSVPSDTVTAVDALIQEQVTPDAVTAVVHNTVNVVVPVTVLVYLYSSANLTSAAVQTQGKAILDSFFATLPVGGLTLTPFGSGAVLFRSIEAALAQISPFVIEVRTDPEVDVPLAAGQVAVPGAYSIGVVQVPGP